MSATVTCRFCRQKRGPFAMHLIGKRVKACTSCIRDKRAPVFVDGPSGKSQRNAQREAT